MSSRKRPLTEISQSHNTPSRYAPSTPHAIRALQQRSGAKNRSIRSARQVPTDTVRPDSIRGVLRQFAKISAPITNKRVATPSSIYADKENERPNNEEDDDIHSELLKPKFTFAIEESLEEDDSEILVAPTPSVLPDDDDDQPTTTFHNITHIPLRRPVSERSDRRRSRPSLLRSEPLNGEEQDDQDVGDSIMTERGRRAMSEDATGRLSRYSFGNFRMSDFGSELEIRREPDEREKTARFEIDEVMPLGQDDSINNGDTEDLRHLNRFNATDIEDDTVHLSEIDNETFRLDLPDEDDRAIAHEAPAKAAGGSHVLRADLDIDLHQGEEDIDEPGSAEVEVEAEESSRQQTLLETSTVKSHATRRERVKLTRHGTTVPSLPTNLIKQIVLGSYEKQSKRKPTLGRDHIKALEQATEWFFEQVGEDLAAYSSHGRRKKRVDTNDVLLLMKRQRVGSEDGELRKLAKEWLPKEVLAELDLPETI